MTLNIFCSVLCITIIYARLIVTRNILPIAKRQMTIWINKYIDVYMYVEFTSSSIRNKDVVTICDLAYQFPQLRILYTLIMRRTYLKVTASKHLRHCFLRSRKYWPTLSFISLSLYHKMIHSLKIFQQKVFVLGVDVFQILDCLKSTPTCF